MKFLRSHFLVLLGSLGLGAGQAVAGPAEAPVSTAPTVSDSPWEFRLEPYFWASGISGTTGVLGVQVPTDLSFKNIFDNLKMSFAGQMELRYRRLGLLTDFFYADIGGYIPVRDPRIRQLALDDKLFIFQALPNFRLFRSNQGFFDVLAGVRVMSSELRLTGFRANVVTQGGPQDFRYFKFSGKQTWADFVAGVRGQYFLAGNLFAAAYADIGGGSSELTWQVQGTMGYRFSRLVSAEVGWRLLSDNYQNGGFTYNVKQQGLYTGVSFIW